MCVCVYVYVCAHAYVCICKCTFISMCMCICVCMCMCIYVYMYICISVCAYVYTFTSNDVKLEGGWCTLPVQGHHSYTLCPGDLSKSIHLYIDCICVGDKCLQQQVDIKVLFYMCTSLRQLKGTITIFMSHQKYDSFSLGVEGLKSHNSCYEMLVCTRYSTVATGTEPIYHLS